MLLDLQLIPNLTNMFFLVYKPVGITSFDVIRKMRKILNIKKMGHIGTLDPLADGLMLVATDQSTKLLPFLNSDKKTYIFEVALDGKSKSLDLWENIEPIDVSHRILPDAKFLENLLKNTTKQAPPKFSALHVDGKRAYELARNDAKFTLPEREITVFDAEVQSMNEDKILIRMTISSGWYIRSFAPVIGKICGIDGGYISRLSRVELWFDNYCFSLSDATRLENLTIQDTLPETQIFRKFVIKNISNNAILADIKNGIPPTQKTLAHIFGKSQPKNGQKVLLIFEQNYSSLLEMTQEGARILRNDVVSFG